MAHDEHGKGEGGGHGDGHEKKHKKHHPHAHAEHEHEEGWIVSFADNVLLMMGFFVILLAMNMGPKGSTDGPPGESAGSADDRLLDLAIAVREAFHNPVSMGSVVPEDQPLIRRLRERQSRDNPQSESPNGEQQRPQTIRPTDWAGDGGFVQFAEKETLIDEAAREILAGIADRVRGTRWILEIRGHASRWETWRDTKAARDLAYERAYNVGNALSQMGIPWDRIRLVSSGTAAPIVARARTADEAVSNQRTEILVLNEVMPEDPYGNAPERQAP
jgi:outer membrane protein OmpA-like peptidoglycan-associated protein